MDSGKNYLMPGVSKREVLAWASYDFANSGYTTVILTAVYNAFFVSVVAENAVWATFAWTLTITLSNLLSIAVIPVISALADAQANKRFWLAVMTGICCMSTATLAYTGHGTLASAVADTAFYTHGLFFKHKMGSNNPECPRRLEKIEELMLAAGTSQYVDKKIPPMVAVTDMLAAHDADYISYLSQNSPKEGLNTISVDTAMNPYTWEAAQYAAGAACAGVDDVLSGQYKKVFCAVRPPGHHAHRDHSGGFCFLNNVAIGALHAIGIYGLKRVAVVDFDVHHGDGTSNILGGRDDVLILDGFQEALFPYAHIHHAPPNAIYTPFPEGTEGIALRRTMDEVWMPRLKEYKPELIMVSAGFDAHREEDQAQLLMVERDYAFLGRRLASCQSEIPECRGVVAVLEGGYNTSSLARSCAAFIHQLACSD